MTSWFLLLLGLAVGIAVVLFLNPIAMTVDTRRGELEVRWTALLRARWPLRQDGGDARWFFAGMPFPFPPSAGKPRTKEPRAREQRAARLRPSRLIRFLLECAGDPSLRRAIVVQAGKLARGTVRSLELGHWHAELSFADPALNGMLSGWLMAAGGSGRHPVGVNFLGRSWLEVEVRLYPYRLAFAGMAFLVRLSHRAVFRHWRHSGASKA